MLKTRSIIIIPFLFILISAGVFIWNSRQKPEAVKKVYKVTTPQAPPPAVPVTTHQGLDPERFITGLKEVSPDDKRLEKFITFLKSEEGQAFLRQNPSLAEINEKRQSFLPQSPLTREQMKARWYADMLPADKTLEEIEQDMLNYISEVIRDNGFHLEDPTDPWNNSEVLGIVTDHPQIFPFLSKKFNDTPGAGAKWLTKTIDSLMVSEYEKAGIDNDVTSISTDVATSKETESAMSPEPTDTSIPNALEDLSELAPGTASDNDTENKNPLAEQSTPEQPPLNQLSKLPIKTQIVITLRHQKLPPERFFNALKALETYGPIEAVQHLKASDPEVAKSIETILQQTPE